MLNITQSLDQAITHDGDATRKAQRSAVACAALTGIILGAILLRLGFAFYLPRVVKFDETTYLEIARNLVTGQGLVRGMYPESGQVELLHPPLQSIVLALSYLVTGDLEWASNLAYALFGGLLLLPVFYITLRIYDLRTAWLVAILLAIFPALTVSVLYWGAMIEPLFLCLIFGGLAALLAGLEDNRLGRFAAAGGLLGVAYLTRPEGFVYFVAFLTLALLCLAERPGLGSLRTWRPLGLFVLSFVLFAAPYVGYLHAYTGRWMLSGNYKAWQISEAMASKNPATWAAYDRAGSDRWFNALEASAKKIWPPRELMEGSVLGQILAHPMRLVHQTYANIHILREVFFHKHVFWYGLLPLVMLALFKRPWERRRLRHEAFLVTTIIVLMLVFLPMGVLIRYFAPAFPVLLMWSARGTLELGVWVQETVGMVRERAFAGGRLKAMLSWLPAGMLVFFFLAMIPVAVSVELDDASFGHKQAGLWLKTHTPADAKVMHRSGIISFYSDRRETGSPNTDWVRLLKFARSQGANYLVVDTGDLTKLRPQLAFILENRTPELELVYSFKERTGETLVYRFVPSGTERISK